PDRVFEGDSDDGQSDDRACAGDHADPAPASRARGDVSPVERNRGSRNEYAESTCKSVGRAGEERFQHELAEKESRGGRVEPEPVDAVRRPDGVGQVLVEGE